MYTSFLFNSNALASVAEEYLPEILDNEIIAVSSGSGFFISQDGYIVTNIHVVDGCDVDTTSYKGRDYEALILAYDKSNDLSDIKVDLKAKKNFSVASFSSHG